MINNTKIQKNKKEAFGKAQSSLKILLVLALSLTVLHCSSDDDDPGGGPLDGTWTGECSAVFSSTRSYIFSGSSLKVILRAYAGTMCSGDVNGTISYEYSIRIGEETDVMLSDSGMSDTVTGREIDHTGGKAEAEANNADGVMLIEGFTGMSGEVSVGNPVPIPAMVPGTDPMGDPIMINGKLEGTYLGVYYLDTSVDPDQLYVGIGFTENTMRDTDITSDNVYTKQ